MVKHMKVGSRILRVLLIATLVMATSLTSARAEADLASGSPARQLATSGKRPATCHAHGATSSHVPPAQSAPALPVSHQCCLTGHDVAVVQSSFRTPSSERTSERWINANLKIAPVLTLSFFERLSVMIVLPADPPGWTPLRI
jgi:hypothetical protein